MSVVDEPVKGDEVAVEIRRVAGIERVIKRRGAYFAASLTGSSRNRAMRSQESRSCALGPSLVRALPRRSGIASPSATTIVIQWWRAPAMWRNNARQLQTSGLGVQSIVSSGIQSTSSMRWSLSAAQCFVISSGGKASWGILVHSNVLASPASTA